MWERISNLDDLHVIILHLSMMFIFISTPERGGSHFSLIRVSKVPNLHLGPDQWVEAGRRLYT